MVAQKVRETVLVCSRCSCSVHNDDWSWIDSDPTLDAEGSLAEFGRLTASAELLSSVVESKVLPYGYWDCWVCGDTLCHDVAVRWGLSDR